jgi:hypothetical protein
MEEDRMVDLLTTIIIAIVDITGNWTATQTNP